MCVRECVFVYAVRSVDNIGSVMECNAGDFNKEIQKCSKVQKELPNSTTFMLYSMCCYRM